MSSFASDHTAVHFLHILELKLSEGPDNGGKSNLYLLQTVWGITFKQKSMFVVCSVWLAICPINVSSFIISHQG